MRAATDDYFYLFIFWLIDCFVNVIKVCSVAIALIHLPKRCSKNCNSDSKKFCWYATYLVCQTYFEVNVIATIGLFSPATCLTGMTFYIILFNSLIAIPARMKMLWNRRVFGNLWFHMSSLVFFGVGQKNILHCCFSLWAKFLSLACHQAPHWIKIN